MSGAVARQAPPESPVHDSRRPLLGTLRSLLGLPAPEYDWRERGDSLAGLLPLWRTLREFNTTVLVSKQLDYIGALELGRLHVDLAGDEAAEGVGEQLRALLAAQDDGTVLHFLYRSEVGCAEDMIRRYESGLVPDAHPALAAHVRDRAAYLRAQPLRTTRVYLFFSRPRGRAAMRRGLLANPLPFLRPKYGAAEHRARVEELALLRDRLRTRLEALGLSSREMDLDEVYRLYHALLNPGAARAGVRAPAVRLRADVFAEEEFARGGDWLREYSEAEQLCSEDLREVDGALIQGGVYRRVLSLKSLPEFGTDHYELRRLLEGLRWEGAPLPVTVAVTVGVPRQDVERRRLSNTHELVSVVRDVFRWAGSRGVAQTEADEAQKESIRALFTELAASSTKVVRAGVHVLLEAPTLDLLHRYTEVAKAAISHGGNAQAQDEEVTQLRSFLSMLPCAQGYGARDKGCTSLNAADLLPVYGPWLGSSRPVSLMTTPGGDLVGFDPFDYHLSNSWHGVVAADSGSGKSFLLGSLVLDARANGLEAVLVDNGRSWAALTEALGGVHVDVDLRTSISPFLSFAEVWDEERRELSAEELDAAAGFIEVLVQDRSRGGFDNPERNALTHALRWTYETRFRSTPDERPLLGDFHRALVEVPWERVEDRQAMAELHRRLELFVSGNYREFLNKPSTLRWDAPLLTFEMSKVAENPVTKVVALTAIMQAVANRAHRKARRNTLFVIDEAHEYLGDNGATEQFLGRAYRKYRKAGINCYVISQSVVDFLSTRIGRDAIVGNAMVRLFLRHQPAKQGPVVEHFRMPPRMAEAFGALDARPGWYSEFLLQYGSRSGLVRFGVSGFQYWLLTTDPGDRALIEKAAARNPHLSRLDVLRELARLYPHGAVGAR